MNAVDEIRAAIERLNSWRGAGVPLPVRKAVGRAGRRGHRDAMIGLIRLTDDTTIDAQLAILREGLSVAETMGKVSDVAAADWAPNELALARAINGGTN